jgi:hypothetical protein
MFNRSAFARDLGMHLACTCSILLLNFVHMMAVSHCQSSELLVAAGTVAQNDPLLGTTC